MIKITFNESFFSFNKSNGLVPNKFSICNIAVLVQTEKSFSLKLESRIHTHSIKNTFVNLHVLIHFL